MKRAPGCHELSLALATFAVQAEVKETESPLRPPTRLLVARRGGAVLVIRRFLLRDGGRHRKAVHSR
ncbi:hypothetical protein MUK42_12676 [Musa troglodytarum]|uniref:Uncharacterized protein n=1 Tax=Musa troglodytarum TaxID=320322 RepID=A0A9E7GZD3_9LILI|nr:hypothetical protein MUK42_12676 [Musa troglodytarum]